MMSRQCNGGDSCSSSLSYSTGVVPGLKGFTKSKKKKKGAEILKTAHPSVTFLKRSGQLHVF